MAERVVADRRLPAAPGGQGVSHGRPRPVAGAEQVEPGDAAAVVGVGVGLLLDGEPAGAEPLRLQPQPPVQVQAAPDLADRGLDELEILGVAEPARELVGDRLGAGPLPQAPGQQRAQPDVGGERATEPGEVLSGQALEERPGQGELRYRGAALWLVLSSSWIRSTDPSAGANRVTARSFRQVPGSPAAPVRPWRMANRAASVRVFTPSLA